MKSRPASHAFSLIELLTVVAIVAILAVLAVSALGGALSSYRLAVGADALAGRLEAARLLAASRNKMVEFRLIQPAGQDWQFFQVLVENENGETVPHGNIVRLPDGIRLRTGSEHGGMLTLPAETVPAGNRYAGAACTGLRFHPSGMVKSLSDASNAPAITSANNFLTLSTAGSDTSLPANWIALRIDPKTGAVSRFQP